MIGITLEIKASEHLIAWGVCVIYVESGVLLVGNGALFRFLVGQNARARAYAEALIAVLLEGSDRKMSMRATSPY